MLSRSGTFFLLHLSKLYSFWYRPKRIKKALADRRRHIPLAAAASGYKAEIRIIPFYIVERYILSRIKGTFSRIGDLIFEMRSISGFGELVPQRV